MSNPAFEQRCLLAEQCLPDAPYRATLKKLHAEMLAALPAQQEDGPINEGWHITVTNGHSGYGVYAHMEDYPEEGAVLVQMIEQPAQKRPQNCGTSYCSCIECVMEPAQPQQEPVGEVLDERGQVDWISFVPPTGTPLYTALPQRQPLTDEQIEDMYFDGFSISKLKEFARAVEAAHDTKEQP